MSVTTEMATTWTTMDGTALAVDSSASGGPRAVHPAVCGHNVGPWGQQGVASAVWSCGRPSTDDGGALQTGGAWTDEALRRHQQQATGGCGHGGCAMERGSAGAKSARGKEEEGTLVSHTEERGNRGGGGVLRPSRPQARAVTARPSARRAHAKGQRWRATSAWPRWHCRAQRGRGRNTRQPWR